MEIIIEGNEESKKNKYKDMYYNYQQMNKS